MNKKAQYACATIFLSIVIKGFFTELNIVDSVILSATAGIYAMYEYLTETKIRTEFEEYKKKTDNELIILEQKFNHAKDNISKLSVAQGLRR